MELIVAIVAIVAMTLLSGSVLSKIYDGDSTPRFYQETHVATASIETLVVGGLLAFLFQLSFFAVGAVALLTALTWGLVRVFIKRGEQMLLWDKTEVVRLALCLVVSVFASYVLSSTVGIIPGMGPLCVGFIFAACWTCHFPI